jgi:cyclic pyranopterin phosphate synthase
MTGAVLPARRSLEMYVAPPPRSVRISLTDRCDLACVYCRPSRSDGYLEQRLDDLAWHSMIEGLARAGVRRVRITGGEPLLHPRVVELVGFVSSVGFEDIALTTNGTRLERLAVPLRRAGLMRLTVSIDSLDAVRFRRITRGGDLEQVLSGVRAALGAGFDEVKLNCVVLRGENDDELEAITEWAWERGITPRFIELMPIAEGAQIVEQHLVTASEMRERLRAVLEPDEARADSERGPAKYVRARRDPRLRVGFITGTSDTFCESCDRLRVAADGMLRPCLATDVGLSAKAEADRGDRAGIAAAIGEAWKLKPDGTVWKGCTEESAARVSMRAIGG